MRLNDDDTEDDEDASGPFEEDDEGDFDLALCLDGCLGGVLFMYSNNNQMII
jgi:hypothetical protein